MSSELCIAKCSPVKSLWTIKSWAPTSMTSEFSGSRRQWCIAMLWRGSTAVTWILIIKANIDMKLVRCTKSLCSQSCLHSMEAILGTKTLEATGVLALKILVMWVKYKVGSRAPSTDGTIQLCLTYKGRGEREAEGQKWDLYFHYRLSLSNCHRFSAIPWVDFYEEAEHWPPQWLGRTGQAYMTIFREPKKEKLLL